MKPYIPIMIINCVTIVCFTILAVIFDHWWIILFALLFLFTIERKESEDKE